MLPKVRSIFQRCCQPVQGQPDQGRDGQARADVRSEQRPSIDSSFHIVGTIFDTAIKEGVQLTRDNPGGYSSQAVDLSPAQGAIIAFITAEDGLYPFVTHAFNFVGRGALGVVQAGDSDPKN
jgi:hypothetical protein